MPYFDYSWIKNSKKYKHLVKYLNSDDKKITCIQERTIFEIEPIKENGKQYYKYFNEIVNKDILNAAIKWYFWSKKVQKTREGYRFYRILRWLQRKSVNQLLEDE